MSLPARSPRSDMRICFVGDSFVNGTGDPAFLGWTGRICAAAQREGHEITAYTLGIRRDTTADIASRWSEEVARRLPAGTDGRLVFSFGANDTAMEDGRLRVAPGASLANARAILQTARHHRPTLVVGPPPMPDREHTERLLAFTRDLTSLCATLDIACLDVCGPLLACDDWMREASANDGAHPRAGGYDALANLVLRWSGWRAWFD